MRVASFAVVAALATFAAAAAGPPRGATDGPAGEGGQPALTYVRDGKDLVVSASLTVNNSDHVLLTDAFVHPTSGEATLYYVVIHNRDALVRSEKRIAAEWRLPGRERREVTCTVRGTTLLRTPAELKALAGRLQDLGSRSEPAAGRL
jgi:hypothetical protein